MRYTKKRHWVFCETRKRLRNGTLIACILSVQMASAQSETRREGFTGKDISRPFQLSVAEELSVETNSIELVSLASGEENRPTWRKPTSFGTGAWTLLINDHKTGEWLPPKGDNQKPSLRLSQSAVVRTHETMFIVLVEAMPFVLTAKKDKSGTLHLNTPPNDTIRAMTDWVLAGGPGNVTGTTSDNTNTIQQWQWRRDPQEQQGWLFRMGGFPTVSARGIGKSQNYSTMRRQKMGTDIDDVIAGLKNVTTGTATANSLSQAATQLNRFTELINYGQVNTTGPEGSGNTDTPARSLTKAANDWTSRLNRSENAERNGDVTGAHYQRIRLTSEFGTLRTQIVKYLTDLRIQVATETGQVVDSKQDVRDLLIKSENVVVFRIRVNPEEQATK